MDNKFAATIFLVFVLYLIYLDNSGKLTTIKSILETQGSSSGGIGTWLDLQGTINKAVGGAVSGAIGGAVSPLKNLIPKLPDLGPIFQYPIDNGSGSGSGTGSNQTGQ